MEINDPQILQSLREKLPKSASALLSALFFVATVLVNYGASRTHISDVQAQQEKRLDNIEAQIRNDLATRREVDEVKSTVNRIENKLDGIGDRLEGTGKSRKDRMTEASSHQRSAVSETR